MAGFEGSADLTSPEAAAENLEQDEDTSTSPLLQPTAPSDEPESSTRKITAEREEDESHKLRQLRIIATCVGRATDVVLRASAAVLAVIALVLTAMNSDGYAMTNPSEFSYYVKFFLSGYMLSVNVVVLLYSLAILGLTIFQLVNRDSHLSSNLLYLLSIFQLDQTFAYLLVSASFGAFGCVSNLNCMHLPYKTGFCQRALASATVSLLAFLTLAAASTLSFFRLVAKIRSHNIHLALCILLDDGPEACNSQTSKLLP